MSVNLSKGQKMSLTKDNPSLSKITVGLGWDVNQYSGGAEFDLDASVFVCGANGKCRNDNDFIFYKNLDSVDGAIHHTGDNKTGIGDGDDEAIQINLTKVAADVQKIAITVTIYDANNRRQNFGQVSNAYVRVIDDTTGSEIVHFDLGEDFSIETAIVAGEIYRHNGEWKFNAVGAGFQGGLAALCKNYGIDAE